jgi:phosphatidate cytidylyltransferase
MIVHVIVICLSAFLLGGVGLFLASLKQPSAVRRTRLVKFFNYFCIVSAVLCAALAGKSVLSALVAVIAAVGAWELYRVLMPAAGGSTLKAAAIGIAYLLVAVAAVGFAWLSNTESAVTVYLIVCTFDGFSQVTGQLLGKHQISPDISPAKTVEGTLGGLLFAVGMAILLQPVSGAMLLPAVIAACFVVTAAFAGDLLASLIKRKADIKDFSNLLPGHGGILDRFDSFLFAAAACLALGLMGQLVLGYLHLPG